MDGNENKSSYHLILSFLLISRIPTDLVPLILQDKVTYRLLGEIRNNINGMGL